MTSSLASRARRLAVLGPAVLACWSVIVGLPLAPQTGRPGHLETTTVALTGPTARAAGSASGAPVRATPGWARAVDVARGTQMVALTWDAATAPTASARIRSRG